MGSVTLLDNTKTFEMTVPQWTVKSAYTALNKKESSYTHDWADYKHLNIRTCVYKDYKKDAEMYGFGDNTVAHQVREAFGEDVLTNCLIIKHCICDTYRSVERKSYDGVTDLENYCKSIQEKYRVKYETARNSNKAYVECMLIPFAYVKVCPRVVPYCWVEGNTTTTADLLFYDKEDRLVAKLVSGCHDDGNSTHGAYDREKFPSKEKVIKTATYLLEREIPVMEDSGCIDCKDSEYHIENGVYLRCKLCGKEVKEIDYDGEHYPEYCNRNIAKKIRTYEERKASMSA